MASKRRWNLPKDAPEDLASADPAIIKLRRTRAKKIAFGAIAVVIVILGASLLAPESAEEADQSIARISESHTCRHCGNVFTLTVAQAAKMRRARGSVACPTCGEPGAVKTKALSAARTPPVDEDRGDVGSREPDTPKRNQPRQATQHMRKKDG